MTRSQTVDFPHGMSEKDHILRLARGASCLGLSLEQFIEGLAQYVDEPAALDRQPLAGWWYLGGPQEN